MSLEYILEHAFLQEVKAAGQLWVARGAYRNIYSEELGPSGFSLPVWSTRERVLDYLKNARPVGTAHEPHPVSLKTFTDVWLSDKMMDITELQLNPNGKTTRILCVTPEEFRSDLARAGGAAPP